MAILMPPVKAVTVNGHRPVIVHDQAADVMFMRCEKCQWRGQDHRGRKGSQVENCWPVHAAHIALGVTVVHGTQGTGCWCVACVKAVNGRWP